jgi:uncharacterized protein YuzE
VSVTIAGIEFDNVSYDEGGDVLYLHVGDPASAVEFDETPEGHALRFDSDGELVGLTLVRPQHLLATTGEVKVTLPDERRIPASDLERVLA